MALIHCRECGKKISDTANSCPNCGAKQSGSSKGGEECKECGKELHFWNKAIGKYKGLCSGCAMKENTAEYKKKMGELKEKSAKDKVESEKKQATRKKEFEEIKEKECAEKDKGTIKNLRRKEYPEEVDSSIKKNFGNEPMLIDYMGGHPDLSTKATGELILTKKKLIFKGVDMESKECVYTKDSIEIPLKSITDIEFKPEHEEAGDVATGIVKERILGAWSIFLRDKTKPILMISIKDKGMKIGIGFDFSGLLMDSNEIGNRWKNEIVKYRYKA